MTARSVAAALLLALFVAPAVLAHGTPIDSPDLPPGERFEYLLDEVRVDFGSRHDARLRGALDGYYDPAALEDPTVFHIGFRDGTYGAWDGVEPATFTAQAEFVAPLYAPVTWTNLGSTTETVTHADLLPAPPPEESPALPMPLLVLAAVAALALSRSRARRARAVPSP